LDLAGRVHHRPESSKRAYRQTESGEPVYHPAMSTQRERADQFLRLHHGDAPLLLVNAWDVGSARILAALGFEALATTSSGHAATLGLPDGAVTRDQALDHARVITAATSLPVSADLEHGFADDPAGVAETVVLALATGLAGCSIEDSTGDSARPIYERAHATERVAAAAEAAHASDTRLVLTARCENHLYDRPDLDDTLARLIAYQEAGADVLFAPGVSTGEEIGRLVAAVELPVNVLAMPGVPPVSELAELGVRRVSVGGGLAFAALGAMVRAATEFRDAGTYSFLELVALARAEVGEAFG
jgi:2-methylisocitrate lyase-like PEP mutase family enzyme